VPQYDDDEWTAFVEKLNGSYKESTSTGICVDTPPEHKDDDDAALVTNTDVLLPPGVPLSSEGARYQQTTVGAILCSALKKELSVDVALLRAVLGNATYSTGNMSYEQLKKELPFPINMVVIPMKRWELQEAIEYSRMHAAALDGVLQADAEYDQFGFHTGNQEDTVSVALPEDLLNGPSTCKPLQQIGERFQGHRQSSPAKEMIIRHFCKERWFEILVTNNENSVTFQDLDSGSKGYLSGEDLRRILLLETGQDPPDYFINDMISAVDANGDGNIDQGELSHLLAEQEQEHCLFQFA
jgi:hypothetical protein